MYKIGFSSLGSPDYNVDQLIDIARSSGYDGVELRIVGGEMDLTRVDDFAPGNLATTRKRFDDAGLAVACLDSSVKMTSLVPEERQAQVNDAIAYAEIAAGLGAPYLRVFGGETPDGQDPDATYRAIIDGLGIVAEETARRGVTSLVETHDAFSTAQSVRALFDDGVSDKLAVLWDSYHTYWHKETPQQSWDLIGPLVRHVHVKDSSDVTPGAPFRAVLTGDGVVPIRGILDLLTKVGYDGFVDFEWEKHWYPELPEPEIAIPQFADYVRRVHSAR